jgi:hypothetical protein
VTHLRQAMLDELQRRNYARTTVQYYIRPSSDSPSISTVRQTSSIRRTCASTKPTCYVTANSSREP